jgi:SnoaL-like domain
MRLTLAALPLVACAVRAGPTVTAFDAAAATRDVAAVLDDWHDAAAHADEARYFGHFAPAGVFLGTDATERWDVPAFRAYAHPHFAEGRAWTFHAVGRHVAFSDDGRVAWFDEALATERLGPARGSGVLVRGPSGWAIAQYNLALTVPNERFADVKKLLEAR